MWRVTRGPVIRHSRVSWQYRRSHALQMSCGGGQAGTTEFQRAARPPHLARPGDSEGPVPSAPGRAVRSWAPTCWCKG